MWGPLSQYISVPSTQEALIVNKRTPRRRKHCTIVLLSLLLIPHMIYAHSASLNH